MYLPHLELRKTVNCRCSQKIKFKNTLSIYLILILEFLGEARRGQEMLYAGLHLHSKSSFQLRSQNLFQKNVKTFWDNQLEKSTAESERGTLHPTQ